MEARTGGEKGSCSKPSAACIAHPGKDREGSGTVSLILEAGPARISQPLKGSAEEEIRDVFLVKACDDPTSALRRKDVDRYSYKGEGIGN